MSDTDFLRLSRRLKQTEKKTAVIDEDMVNMGYIFNAAHASSQSVLKLGNGMVMIMGQIPTTSVPASGVSTIYISHMSLLSGAPIAVYLVPVCNTVANIMMEAYVIGTNIGTTSVALRHNYSGSLSMGAYYMIIGLLK